MGRTHRTRALGTGPDPRGLLTLSSDELSDNTVNIRVSFTVIPMEEARRQVTSTRVMACTVHNGARHLIKQNHADF